MHHDQHSPEAALREGAARRHPDSIDTLTGIVADAVGRDGKWRQNMSGRKDARDGELMGCANGWQVCLGLAMSSSSS